MFRLPVYKAEIADGLAEALTATDSLSYACSLESLVKDRATAEYNLVLSSCRSRLAEQSSASLNDDDLHLLQTVLVSTGWNKNDDVFDRTEVWAARHSPVHKPFNFEHNCDDIIGHIISNWVMGDDGSIVMDETAVDDLPKKFHIVTGAVLYKYWSKPELQNRMDRVRAEIAQGQWYVSTECLFRGFDYAMTGDDGVSRVVARNEQTAFLTKHLRVYGGRGVYDNYKVGRVLRNILFSGKGLVRNPANPESVILPQTDPFIVSNAGLITDFSQICAAQVYSPLTEQDSEQRREERNQQMANELEAMQKQLETLKTENEQLKAALREGDVKEFKTKTEAAEAAKAKADELLAQASSTIKELQDQSVAAQAEAKTAQTKLAETEQALTETRDELKGLYAAQRKETRITQAKSKLNLSDEDAAEYVTVNESLADEAFAKQIELLAKNMAKQTTAPVSPAAAPTPSPAQTVAEEGDKTGEQTVAAADLENVEPNKDNVSLSTASTDSGVNDVAKAIAEYFGVKTENQAQ